MRNVIIKLGGVIIVSILLFIGVVSHFDGRVFDLPNHKLLVLNGGIHLYDKAITLETSDWTTGENNE